jgi:hypothetical protein
MTKAGALAGKGVTSPLKKTGAMDLTSFDGVDTAATDLLAEEG